MRHSVGWRGTVGLRGRRKPVHGGLVAASMRLTPRKPTVPRLRQVHAAVGGCRPLVGTSVRYRMNSSTHGVALPCRPRPAVGRCRPLVDTSVRHRYPTPCRPTVGTHQQQQHVLTDRRELSKAGWVRLRGCERHGWRDQAPMDGFTASPSTGPTPPTQRNPASAVALAPAGAGLQALQNKQTYLNRTSRLLPADTTASHATPCQPHCASARLPSAPPAAMPMNMPVNNSALRRLRADGTRP